MDIIQVFRKIFYIYSYEISLNFNTQNYNIRNNCWTIIIINIDIWIEITKIDPRICFNHRSNQFSFENELIIFC